MRRSYSLTLLTTLVIIVASLKTAAFGYYQGFTFELAVLMAGLLILIDWFKVATAERVRSLWEHSQWMRFGIALCGLICLCVWSFATTVGVYSLTRYETSGSREASTRRFDLTQDEIKRLTNATSTPRPRSVEEAKADLTQLQAKRINGKTVQEGVGDCTNLESYVARTYCPQIAKLEGEIASAQRWFDAEATLAKLRSTSAATDRPPSGDIQAQVFSRLLGIDIETIKTSLIVALALLVEFVTSFGYILAGSKFETRRLTQNEVAVSAILPQETATIQTLEVTKVADETPPVSPPEVKRVAKMKRRRRRSGKPADGDKQPKPQFQKDKVMFFRHKAR